MLFWNSDGGNADIVAALQSLIDSNNAGTSNMLAALQDVSSSLANLNIDMPRFSHTLIDSIDLPPNTITKIVNRESASRRTTLQVVSDATASNVLLIHGVIKPVLEDFLNSPWSLSPGQQGFDNLDGGYEIWAYAVGGGATIKTALEYQDDDREINQSTNQLMKIETLIGTGANWSRYPEWYDQYNSINATATGYKLFSFSSFNPNQDYTVTIDPGDLNYDSSSEFPINMYLFHIDDIIKALFLRLVSSSMNLDLIRNFLVPIVKNRRSWVGKLPPTGGDITLTPSNNRHIGMIDVRLAGELYAQTAVFNYTQGNETGTFTLVNPL